MAGIGGVNMHIIYEGWLLTYTNMLTNQEHKRFFVYFGRNPITKIMLYTDKPDRNSKVLSFYNEYNHQEIDKARELWKQCIEIGYVYSGTKCTLEYELI